MKRFIILPLLFLAVNLFAVPISEPMARKIAAEFFSIGTTRSSAVQLELAWAGSDAMSISAARRHSVTAEFALMYIYNRTDRDGFVVIAGDDSVLRPILAFSHNNGFDTQDVADGARVLLSDMCKQIRRVQNGSIPTMQFSTRTDVGKIVCEYETALWGQGVPFRDKSPGGRIGCVTTALAIIAHYNKWPNEGVGTTVEYSYKGTDGNTHTVPANKLGQKYDYNNMLNKYKGINYTNEQAESVASLFYDIGTAVGARFDENNTTPIFDWALGMSTYFRYNKGAIKLERTSYTEQEWLNMLKRNLEDYGPMVYRGTHATDNEGHAFVMDGYTDANYFRFNFGWDGKSNGYYLLDNIDYSRFQAAVFYMTPDKDNSSTYQDLVSVVSFTGASSGINYKGIHTDAIDYMSGKQFNTYVGVINAGNVDFLGEIGVAHCDKSDNIKSVLVEKTITRNAGRTNGYTFKTQISPSKIAIGDKLRLVYKGEYSSDWQIARKYSNLNRPQTAYEEVLICPTAEQVAKLIQLKYDKINKTLIFYSPLAVGYKCLNGNGIEMCNVALPSFTEYVVDVSSYELGEYTLLCTGGETQYVLNIVL